MKLYKIFTEKISVQIIRLAIIGISFICIFSTDLFSQLNVEIGQLKVENFSPKTYKSHPQNWAITQDKNGLLYFGNNLGVLVYDGLNWELVRTENESTVRSLDVSPKGKVFVGASGDFGYIDADNNGRLSYVSLRKLYNLNEDKIGDVYNVSAFDQGVYFMTTEVIFFYDGVSMKLWETKTAFQSAYRINGAYIVNQLGIGLCKMVDDSLLPMSDVNDFSQMRLYDIVQYSDDEMLVLTERNGIFNFYKKNQLGPDGMDYRTNINSTVNFYNPYNGAYLKNKILSVGTWGHGLLLVDEEGDIVQEINSESGLIDEVITDQFIDRDGTLWITTSNGISKISFDRELSKFGETANLNETVEKVVEFGGQIYLATHTGLFRWEEENKSGRFYMVAGINTECWDILPLEVAGKKMMLIAGNNALYQLDLDLKLKQIVTCMPWTIHQLKSDPTTIFVGLDNGLMCLKYEAGSWKIIDKVGGITNTVYSISQTDDRRLWLGTLNNGAIRLDLKERITHYPYQFDVRYFGQEQGLPEGGVFVSSYVGGLLFGTSNGIYEYHEKENKFTEEIIYKDVLAEEGFTVHRLSEDPEGRLWMSAYWDDEFYLGYFKRSGSSPIWNCYSLKPIADEVYHTFFHEKPGVTWLGGPNGLYRYALNENKQVENNSYKTLIRRVWLNSDSLDFTGNFNAQNYKDSSEIVEKSIFYPYNYNSISFTFSSQFHKHDLNNTYSYNLAGFDQEWSDWTKEIKSVYTNLPEGDYVFRVKSKNVYGEESEISEYPFSILAPWYRSWWAYIVYLISSVVFVYFVVILYTKKLKKIIRERTKEVVLQKEEIEKQKDEVEEQRKLLEVKNADITSSINYARRLQEAILPNQDLIDKHLKEHFIMYKPKDIVSGDFYWLEHVNGVPGQDITLFATVDCTGHGVPGAFVSVVGNGGLNRAVNEFGLRQPADILEKLNEIVVDTLSKGDQELRDGMDISLCSFDFNKMEMQFAGANNSVYILRKDIHKMNLGLNGSAKYFKEDLCEIKANKQPVGFYEFHQKFKNSTIKLQEGDVIYLFSDGFTDQFGGPEGKKYNVTRFKNFLLSIYDQPMSAQRDLIHKEFEEWKGIQEQIDDVIVSGIRI